MNRGLKALYKVNKKYLNALHQAYGFDYNKPFYCDRIKGKFTINKILKTLEEKGYTPSNSTIALCIRIDDALSGGVMSYRKGNTYTVEIRNGGTFKIEVNKTTALDTFWRKSDFEEMRKSDLTITWIIAQKDTDTQARHGERWGDDRPNFNGWGDRFKIESMQESYKSFNATTSDIYRLTLRATDGTNKKGGFDRFERFANDDKTALHAIIDKSGYLVINKREYLKEEAERTRRTRAKSAMDATDTTAIIEAIKTRIEAVKIMLSAQFEAVNDYESASNFEKKLGYWDGLTGIYSDFERIQKNINEKKFDSIKSFNNSVDYLNKKISNLLTA